MRFGGLVFIFARTFKRLVTMDLFSILKLKRPVSGTVSKQSLRDVSYLGKKSSYMRALYAQIESYMKVQRPFLRGEFSLGDMSRRLHTTRNNISVAINSCSGLNFRGYINSYRVKHAVELMRMNPNMKKEEIAKLSGFNTLPTFNSSFKKNVKMTPGKYFCEHIVAGEDSLPAMRYPSKSGARKRQD